MKRQELNFLEHALERFLMWLNTEGAAAADFRKVTDLVVQRSIEKKSEWIEWKYLRAWDRKIDPICRRIDKEYPTYSVPFGPLTPGGRPYIDRRPVRKKFGPNDSDLEACFAKGHMFELFSAGMLGKIRRCEWQPCRLYFCGRVGKRFCSRACMRKHMRQTPEYRKKNREHQKAFYERYFKGRRGKDV
jgi:hypothetical protein